MPLKIPMAKYPLEERDLVDIQNRFTYHRPIAGSDQNERYQELRDQARYLATSILAYVPPSRERSLALTKLEEVVMWANAAIARNEVATPAPVFSAPVDSNIVVDPKDPSKRTLTPPPFELAD